MANTRWDATVADLQAETGMSNDELAVLAGYSTPGDGGAGLLRFATSIAAKMLVTNATNTTPIVITTSSPHELSQGERVMIAGILGNTAANGTWLIVNPTSLTFELVGSAGNGAYASGGAVGDGGARIPSSSATIGMWNRIFSP